MSALDDLIYHYDALPDHDDPTSDAADAELAELRAERLAADERIAQLEAALRDVRDRMNDATDSDLQGEDWHCYVRYDAEMVSIIDRAIRAGGAK